MRYLSHTVQCLRQIRNMFCFSRVINYESLKYRKKSCNARSIDKFRNKQSKKKRHILKKLTIEIK